MPGQVPPAVAARVRDLHERGIGAINVGRIGSGGRLLRTGLRLLGWPADHPADTALTARILISLAPVEIQRGRPDAGLGLLDEAQRLSPRPTAACCCNNVGCCCCSSAGWPTASPRWTRRSRCWTARCSPGRC